MTRRAVFGDFLDLARRQLDASPGPVTPAGGEDVQGACDSMARLVVVMARYVDDITPPGAPARGIPADAQPGWDRARAEARQALATMAAILHANTARSKPRPASGPRTTLAHRLDAAAVSLTAGRDLLQSHLGLAPDGTREYRTDWAPTVTSPDMARAMLTEIASLSRQAAAQGAQLAITPGWRGSPDARRRLSTACQWAWILDAAVRVADRKEPLREADRELLRTIPVSVLPPYRQPEPDESVQDLCQGIREAGERLRRASWASARDAVWSPWSTVTALRIVAAANTVTSHNSQAVLQTLATSCSGSRAAGLLTAAEAAGTARTAWLATAHALKSVTTDSRHNISAEATEARNLALWTGRLIYDDSQWTVSSGPSHPHRDPAALAGHPGGVMPVLAAIHQAMSTTRFVASADYTQLRTAAQAGRVLAPVSTLPDTFDIPCAFTRAPDDRVRLLLATYRQAATASGEAVAAVAEIHGAQAPATPDLGISARAGRVRREQRQTTSGLDASGEARAVEGPVERVVRDLGITRPDLLQRARAIDQVSERLIIEAAEDRHPLPRPVGENQHERGNGRDHQPGSRQQRSGVIPSV